jgi:hypothetical protein
MVKTSRCSRNNYPGFDWRPRNCGHQNARLAGPSASVGDAVITIDVSPTGLSEVRAPGDRSRPQRRAPTDSGGQQYEQPHRLVKGNADPLL